VGEAGLRGAGEHIAEIVRKFPTVDMSVGVDEKRVHDGILNP
jgi:hypothetical protein